MPWRETSSPYRTWISEAMLQQTRVETVVPFFERFMNALPDVESLAAAPIDQVLSLWSGLGYYSRARNLHKAAQQIVAQGSFPTTVADLRALPGVGPYMAGAIASIAFARDVPTVDGNIARVLSRVHRESDLGKRMWTLAASHIPAGRAGDHNQALMDLGARICTPRSPSCGECPISAHCEARQHADIEAFPPRKKRQRPAVWQWTCGIAKRGNSVLLGRRRAEGLFGGLHEPPMFPVVDGDPVASLRAGLGEMGLAVRDLRSVGRIRHVLTHRVLEVDCYTVDVEGSPQCHTYEAAVWADPRQLSDIGLSTLARRALEAG